LRNVLEEWRIIPGERINVPGEWRSIPGECRNVPGEWRIIPGKWRKHYCTVAGYNEEKRE